MTRFRSLLMSTRGTASALVACTLLAALAACSSSPPLFLRDGRQTQQVQCTSAGDRSSCEQQAQVQCGDGGFDKVGQSDSRGVHTLVFACRAAANGH